MQRKSVTRLAMRLGVCLTLSVVCAPRALASDPVVTPPAATRSERTPATGPRVGGSVGVPATSIVGVAWNADDTPIPAARVRLRNVVTGRLVAAAVTDASGHFSFDGSGERLLPDRTGDGSRQDRRRRPHVCGGAGRNRRDVRSGQHRKLPGSPASSATRHRPSRSTAASAGVTAIAPDAKTCSSPSPGCM